MYRRSWLVVIALGTKFSLPARSFHATRASGILDGENK
jgi:hypothetical protein